MSLRAGRNAAAVIVAALVVATVGCYTSGAPQAPLSIETAALLGGCVHTEPSDWDCPDTSMRIARARDIANAQLLVTTTDGRTRAFALPRGTDALFFTRSATRRFLVPYYDRTNPEKAAALRTGLRIAPGCEHTEPSDWDCPDTSRFPMVDPLRTASVSVAITPAVGGTRVLYLPWRTDAVFLTGAAAETFLLGYYMRTDRRKAQQLRALLDRHRRR